jgi:ubiquinone/menaquinone biosynthesis C-methylase UbiE
MTRRDPRDSADDEARSLTSLSGGLYDAPEVVSEYELQAAELTPCEQALFDAELAPGIDVLDVGVGAGRTTPAVSRLARRYVGIDCAAGMVAVCRHRFIHLDFRVMDAAVLAGLDDRSFDAVVFSFNGIDCLLPAERRELAWREFARVLRPGGKLLVSSHNARQILMRPELDRSSARRLARSLGGWAARSMRQVVRVVRWSAFWRGEGYLMESLHGGMPIWYSTPRRVAEEARRAGFELKQVRPRGYPRHELRWETMWFYYVFVRRSG